ncbi:hypothetical protein D3C85_1506800 [compost metagenome]
MSHDGLPGTEGESIAFMQRFIGKFFGTDSGGKYDRLTLIQINIKRINQRIGGFV